MQCQALQVYCRTPIVTSTLLICSENNSPELNLRSPHSLKDEDENVKYITVLGRREIIDYSTKTLSYNDICTHAMRKKENEIILYILTV